MDGESGECRTRLNEGGALVLPFHGAISSIAIDPIEKKPLRRFLPGTRTYSVGFWHCTMHCPFCQNWQIAQPDRIEGEIIAPDALIRMAKASGLPSISFTYSEPCLHIEYVKECMRLAHAQGLKTILVTNGNILEAPARDILALTDATNVDLKSYSAHTYQKLLGGNLETVKNFIQIAYATGCHVEVTSLLVPGVLDERSEIEGIADFIAAISRAIPLHITPYHPDWRWEKEPLTSRQREHCAAPALERLEHVYLV
jgi:pyruvate formate lyase activating enzyme